LDRVLAPADKADVTPDIWLIDLLYLAAPGRGPTNAGEVDRPDVKVAAIQNSPSDLALTRIIKSAEIVRVPITPNFTTDAAEMLRSGKVDIVGADAGLVDEIVGIYPQAKVIGAFHTNPVAAALPKGRSDAALAKVMEIFTEAKRTGIVQDAIEQVGLRSGVRIAPE
jgi:polar amino acid transport system substrate-binding protein